MIRCLYRRFVGCTLLLGVLAHVHAAEKPLTIALPGTSELDKLTDLTAQFAGVSIQYNPQKLHGTVRLEVRGQVTPAELWAVFNQVLVGQGFTTVISGLPPVYQVVPLNEASGLSASLSDEDAAKLPHQPGFGVVIHELKSLGAESAVKALGTLFSNQTGQIRTLGAEDRKVVIAAPQDKIREALHILSIIDRPGVVPAVRLFRPVRASPQSIQASATGAWAAIGRIGAQPRLAEIQVAPDGAQVVLIATADDIDQLEALAQNLDNAEPIETRSYRPRFFSIEDVASLLQQLLKSDRPGATQVDIVRDKLTNSLVIKATVSQHLRIAEVLKTLDDTPAGARRQLKIFAVKNRQADEIAKTITSLMSAGLSAANAAPGGAGQPPTQPQSAPAPSAPAPVAPTAPAAEVANQPGQGAAPGAVTTQPPGGTPPAVPPPVPAATAATISTTQDNAVVIASDTVTNRLIVLGDPRSLDQVQLLLRELDQRQPQVEIEVILVSLNASQNRDLGVELAALITSGRVSGTVTSLFGLSSAPAGSPLNRTLDTSGLGGVVLNPGDFAGVVKALETITDGRSVIRSQVVANNNAKASINGVVQEPLVSTNASTTVATTSINGTTDAGTQITITPQISAADYVTLSYAITQSSFLGAATQTRDGTPIPPAKSSDTVSSVATIPDGYIIALGGLSTRSRGHSESRIPFLGGIPFLGNLFKSRTDSDSDARFYVFIHASVMRHASFADLRRLSDTRTGQAELTDTTWPAPQPRFVK